MATTTLGGVSLANPSFENDGMTRSIVDVGAQHELLNGDIAYDYVGSRTRWALRWNNVTAAQRNTIITRYLIKTTQAFKPPDLAVAVTVLVVPNSYRESYTEGGDSNLYYTCEMELEQQEAG